MYGTNSSLELDATQLINEFFHDDDEDLTGEFQNIISKADFLMKTDV